MEQNFENIRALKFSILIAVGSLALPLKAPILKSSLCFFTFQVIRNQVDSEFIRVMQVGKSCAFAALTRHSCSGIHITNLLGPEQNMRCA